MWFALPLELLILSDDDCAQLAGEGAAMGESPHHDDNWRCEMVRAKRIVVPLMAIIVSLLALSSCRPQPRKDGILVLPSVGE